MVMMSITSIATRPEVVIRYLRLSKLRHVSRVELYGPLGFYGSGDPKEGLVTKARTPAKPSHMREQDRKSGTHNWGIPVTKLTVYVKRETS
jgi:hypothetical protein